MERTREVLAQDLPCFGGVQLAVDMTLRSALSCEGEAHPAAANTYGAVLLKARTDKETKYPVLVRPMQIGRLGHRNGRPRQGARSSAVRALPSVAHVGTQMDTHARSRRGNAALGQLVSVGSQVVVSQAGLHMT